DDDIVREAGECLLRLDDADEQPGEEPGHGDHVIAPAAPDEERHRAQEDGDCKVLLIGQVAVLPGEAQPLTRRNAPRQTKNIPKARRAFEACSCLSGSAGALSLTCRARLAAAATAFLRCHKDCNAGSEETCIAPAVGPGPDAGQPDVKRTSHDDGPALSVHRVAAHNAARRAVAMALEHMAVQLDRHPLLGDPDPAGD